MPPAISQCNSGCLLLLREEGRNGGREGRAAAGEVTGGADCHQPPGAEVILSSHSPSRPLYPCNPVSQPEDTELTDYVD